MSAPLALVLAAASVLLLLLVYAHPVLGVGTVAAALILTILLPRG
jgi:hypothetical protein